MVRPVAGGTPDAVITAATAEFTPTDSSATVRYPLLVPRRICDVFTAETGGTAITDLLLDATGAAITAVTADDFGQVPAFRLPDGYTGDGVWLDPRDSSTQRFFVPLRFGPTTAQGYFVGAGNTQETTPGTFPVGRTSKVARNTRSVIASSTSVTNAGDFIVDEEGIILAGDGQTQDRALSPTRLIMPRGAITAGRTGQGDDSMFADVFAQASATGKPVRARSAPGSGGGYRLFNENTVPDGVSFTGSARGLTRILCDVKTGQDPLGGALRFGGLTGPSASQHGDCGGFWLSGGNAAQTPLRIGYLSFGTMLRDIRVTNAGVVGQPAVLMQTTQNTYLHSVHIYQNLGDGMWFDLGPANIDLVSCIIRNNGGVNEYFKYGVAPTGTSVVNVPTNIRHFGGMYEGSPGGIVIDAGQGINYFGAQSSMEGTPTAPTLWMKDGATGAAQNSVSWVGGQLKGGDGTGTQPIVKVDRGTMSISGGATARSAPVLAEMGNNGRLNLSRDVVYIGSITDVRMASGATKRTQDVVTRGAGSAVKATAGTTLTTATQAVVPGCSRPVAAGRIYKVSAFVPAKGPTDTDVAYGWTAPANSTLDWTPDALLSTTSATQGSIARPLLAVTDTVVVGTVTSDSVALLTGYLTTTDTAGDLQLTAARGANPGSADVLVSPRCYLEVVEVA